MKVPKTKIGGKSILSRAVSNVSKLIESKSHKEVKEPKLKDAEKKFSENVEKKEKPFRSSRGVVYIGHIPHGFYEDQMKDYFKQFGKVTRVRVARSRHTGKSKGFGYVEFAFPEVAQIAAETMNNYLMCGRLLKTTYIPPEKQHFGFFSRSNWSARKYPKLLNRKTEIQNNHSEEKREKSHNRRMKLAQMKLRRLEAKLKDSGISIKFKPISL